MRRRIQLSSESMSSQMGDAKPRVQYDFDATPPSVLQYSKLSDFCHLLQSKVIEGAGKCGPLAVVGAMETSTPGPARGLRSPWTKSLMVCSYLPQAHLD
jgi:hypothetical protein